MSYLVLPIGAPARPDQPASHVPPVPQIEDPLANVIIPCYGDQLTRVRLAGAKDLRAGCHTPQDRLDHLYPFRIVDWHTKRSFLKVKCHFIFFFSFFKSIEVLIYYQVLSSRARAMDNYDSRAGLFKHLLQL